MCLISKLLKERKRIKNYQYKKGKREETKKKPSDIIKHMQPQYLIKYGLIPEFVGRIPIVVGLNDLDEDALVSILTKPKNALIKQYKTLFKLDGVELNIEDNAVRAVDKKAIKLKTGARGLRTILEDSMLNIMFMTPSDKSIEKVVITEDTILNKTEPEIIKKDNLIVEKEESIA